MCADPGFKFMHVTHPAEMNSTLSWKTLEPPKTPKMKISFLGIFGVFGGEWFSGFSIVRRVLGAVA
jgi:hypothetical protein